MNIWTSLGNIHQIKIEIQIAERQFELNRVENDRQTVALKLYIYNNKIKDIIKDFSEIIFKNKDYEIYHDLTSGHFFNLKIFFEYTFILFTN